MMYRKSAALTLTPAIFNRTPTDSLWNMQTLCLLYDKVTAAGRPNFMGAQIPVPTILNLRDWHDIAVTPDDLRFVAFLTFVFFL